MKDKKIDIQNDKQSDIKINRKNENVFSYNKSKSKQINVEIMQKKTEKLFIYLQRMNRFFISIFFCLIFFFSVYF